MVKKDGSSEKDGSRQWRKSQEGRPQAPRRVPGTSDEGDAMLRCGDARPQAPTRVPGTSDEGDAMLGCGDARPRASIVTNAAYIAAKAKTAEAHAAGEADDGTSPEQQEEQSKRVSAAVCAYVDAGLARNPRVRMYIAVGMRARMSTNLAIAEAKGWTCLNVCEIFRILLCTNPYAYARIGGKMVRFTAKILAQVRALTQPLFSPPLPLSPCSPPPPMAVH